MTDYDAEEDTSYNTYNNDADLDKTINLRSPWNFQNVQEMTKNVFNISCTDFFVSTEVKKGLIAIIIFFFSSKKKKKK